MLGSMREKTGELCKAMRIGRLTRIVFVFLGILTGGVPAVAQETAPVNLRALVKACRSDYERFCAGIQPGNGAILTCLRQHEDALSSSCKAAAQDSRVQLSPGSPANASPASGAADPASEKLPPGTQI